jgi:hypothetical protein
MFSHLLIFSLLLSLALSANLPIPCGKCVGRGEVCFTDRYSCGENLICKVTENGLAPVCLPTFEHGAVCTSVGINTCEKEFTCNYTGSGTCDLSTKGTRIVNDYCLDDEWCSQPLFKCSGNKCVVAAADGACNSNSCPIGQYCDSTQTPPKCASNLAEGADCNLTSTSCSFPNFCNLDTNKCVPSFSLVEDTYCNSTSQCKFGLICDCKRVNPAIPCKTKCVKPVYFFLPATGGVAWGAECNPYDATANTGCACNSAAKVFMYLKEYSSTVPDSCLPIAKDLLKCLVDKGCNQAGTYYRSCMREGGCYQLYLTYFDTCAINPDPSLHPPHCSAQGLAAMMMGLLIAFLL